MTEEIMDKIEEAIDDAIDDWLENIDFIAEEGTTFLKRIGLEHNINASLSYSTGLLNTTAGSFIHFHYNRGICIAHLKQSSLTSNFLSSA